MNRRRFLGAACCLCSVSGAGCLADDSTAPQAEIALLELENHRRGESHEFTVQIEGEDVVFEESGRLEPAGSGNEAVSFDAPVDPGRYTVRVTVDSHAVTASTRELISDGKQCLRLQFHLGDSGLQMEHHLYDRC